MPIIRSSDIGNYLYCRRAWWYQRRGFASANQAELSGGAELHRQHGRKMMVAALLRFLAILLLFAALTLLTIYSVEYLLRLPQ